MTDSLSKAGDSFTTDPNVDRLKSLLRRLARCNDRGQAFSEAMQAANFGPMECRDAFMRGAMEGLCINDFREAAERLRELESHE